MCDTILKVSAFRPFTKSSLMLREASQARQEENNSHCGRRYEFILSPPFGLNRETKVIKAPMISNSTRYLQQKSKTYLPMC